MKKSISFPVRSCFFFFIALMFVLCAAFSGKAVTAKAGSVDTPEIKLNVKSKSMTPESTFTIRVYNTLDDQKITYKSSDSDIASVSQKGVITANKVGDSTITVTVKKGLKTVASLTCDVTVGPAAVSIVLSRSEVTLTEGSRLTLKSVIKPKNTVEDAKFSSSNSDVAAVSSSGRVTAKSPGKATIYAMIDNGKYDKCVVTVVEAKE